MTLEPSTAHGTRPFDCTEKELKCEALTNAVVISRRRSEIPRTISCVCQSAESECQNDSIPIYLVIVERSGVLCRDDWITFLGQIQEVSIPNNVSELCDGCFKGCSGLRRVTFGLSSSLARIGVACFERTGVEEVSVPDGVRELCDSCFKGCKSLRRVIFSRSSSLERLGVEAFGDLWERYNWIRCGLVEITIPDSVRELCDGCFKGCSSLRRVTFGPSSSLEWIGVSRFELSRVEEFSVPDSVRELCDGCFKGCRSLSRVTFSHSSSLERIGVSCFEQTGVEEFSVPDSVRELCGGCFKWCKSLRRVTFGPSSSLERIGVSCFSYTVVHEFFVPDSVRELCGNCFQRPRVFEV